MQLKTILRAQGALEWVMWVCAIANITINICRDNCAAVIGWCCTALWVIVARNSRKNCEMAELDARLSAIHNLFLHREIERLCHCESESHSSKPDGGKTESKESTEEPNEEDLK